MIQIFTKMIISANFHLQFVYPDRYNFCRYDDKWHALFLRAEEREKIGFKA